MRRSAFKLKRNPSRPLTATDTELFVLELLRDYRYLPSTYIKAAYGRGNEHIENVLPDLVERHLIGIPDAARDRCKTKQIPYVYELKPRGLTCLTAKGRSTERALASNWFAHDCLASIIQFSFDRAPAEVPGLIMRTPQAILDHENCPPATRHSLNPFAIPSHPPLNADAPPFGFEYEGELIFFHGFEADNGTETIDTVVRRKIARYEEYLETKGPAKLFGMPSKRMHILFVTTSQARAEHIATLFPNDRFHVKATSGFDTKFPTPDAHMVTEPWLNRDGKTWSILEHLKER